MFPLLMYWSYEEPMSTYQKAGKEARSSYCSNITAANWYNPRLLFTHHWIFSWSFRSPFTMYLCKLKVFIESFRCISWQLSEGHSYNVAPMILTILDSCLSTGCLPSCLKHAVVLLKNPNIDRSYFKNFKPISKLPFLRKKLEKVVQSESISFMINHDVLCKFQFLTRLGS